MRRILFFTITLIIVLLGSCSENGAGIFYEIELEEPISDNNLSNSLSIGAFISTNGSYYISAGNIYTKTYNSTTGWSSLNTPGGEENYLASRIAYYGTYLMTFCTKFYDEGSEVFLSSDYGLTWGDTATVNGIEGDVIELLSAYDSTSTSNRVFIITEYDDPDNDDADGDALKLHSVYEITGITDTSTVSTSIVTALSDTRNMIIDIEFDASGNIWGITPAQAFTDGTLGTGLPSGRYYTGIYYSELFSSMFLAVYKYDDDESDVYTFDGSEWTMIEKDLEKRIYDFEDITVYDSDGDPIHALSLGTASGYYEMLSLSDGFDSPEETADNNYDNYSLADATVFKLACFLHDGFYETFALTSTEGLWYNDALSWDLE
jgi:hypothetical protein